MFSKALLIFIIVNFVSNSYEQKDKKFFRKDYTYIEASESFYKIHTLYKPWFEAKRVCALEGASLFYPENDNEAHAVISFWNTTQQSFWWAYVGISDLVIEGFFETVDGHPVSDVYNNWSPGEPNDANGIEDCVHLRKSGTYNDVRCSENNPFICKKSLLTLEWNHQCNISNLDYIYSQEVGRCYKLHTNPLNWTDASAVCSAEQSYLAVINTQLEADYLVRLTENKTSKYLSGAIHLGFHNRLNEGWRSVRGTSLADTGYVRWGHNQPDGEDREQCGSMLHNGLLNDISCDTRSFFICEHEVDKLSSLFDDRFGNVTVD